jgi:hypothetical protein
VRDFQPGLCLRIHFYTGWQFFLFLLCPLHLGYDWRGQRFGQFPNANSNSNSNSTNGYSNRHWYCNADPYTEGNSTYANTTASPDASASPIAAVAASLCEAQVTM